MTGPTTIDQFAIPEGVDCPRALSWMTPCIARDGALALGDPDLNDPKRRQSCVSCDAEPRHLLMDLSERYQPARKYRQTHHPEACANTLARMVSAYVEAKASDDPEAGTS